MMYKGFDRLHHQTLKDIYLRFVQIKLKNFIKITPILKNCLFVLAHSSKYQEPTLQTCCQAVMIERRAPIF